MQFLRIRATGLPKTVAQSCHGPSVAHAQLPASIRRVRPRILFSNGEQAASVHKRTRSAAPAIPTLTACTGREAITSRPNCPQRLPMFASAGQGTMGIETVQKVPVWKCHRSQQIELHRPFSHPGRRGNCCLQVIAPIPHGRPGPARSVQQRSPPNDSCFGLSTPKSAGLSLGNTSRFARFAAFARQPHGSRPISDLLTPAATPFLCRTMAIMAQVSSF